MNRTLIGAAILGIALMGLFTWTTSGQKKEADQKKDAGPPAPKGTASLSSIKIPDDARFRQAIDLGRDCIKKQEWKQAVETLQAVLDEKTDGLVRIQETDAGDAKKEITRWVSVKFKANNLIGSMPAAGLDVYEATYGPEAKKLLDEAKAKKDDGLLAKVAQRFQHTKAGGEAHAIVVKRFQASVEEHAAGNAKDWPSWRGNVTNTGEADGNAPLLDKPIFRRPLFKDEIDGVFEPDNDDAALDRVTKAIKQMTDANLPVLPGGFPIVSQGIMVVRSPRDIRAIVLKAVDVKDEDGGIIKIKPGEILWKSIPFDRSLAVLLEKSATRNRVDPWLDSYHKVPGFDSFLFDNTMLGTLVTDHRLVYAISDLAVPPHPNLFQPPFINAPNISDVKPLLLRNVLCAFDLKTGKMIWDLNGNEKDEDRLFKDSHFISLPISIGGKLYVLNEKLSEIVQPALDRFGRTMNPFPGESEIRLICIDPNKIVNVTPEIIGKPQPLGTVAQNSRYVEDISRRVNAIQLAYADGILVCPTNAGEMFGIDLMTRSLIWSYSYREKPQLPIGPPIALNPNAFPQPAKAAETTTVVSKWKSAPPAIQAGKLVFTAPDADSIHCVDLRDGKPIWRVSQQKGDLYFAGVFAGRVLIAAEKSLRALDLKDGRTLWSLDTGALPSGQGAASKGLYYLPLQSGEIVAVDIVKGKITARQRGKAGNLVFYDGMVLSQTPTEIAAYPQSSKK